MHSFFHAFIRSFIHSFIHSFFHSFIHSFILRCAYATQAPPPEAPKAEAPKAPKTEAPKPQKQPPPPKKEEEEDEEEDQELVESDLELPGDADLADETAQPDAPIGPSSGVSDDHQERANALAREGREALSSGEFDTAIAKLVRPTQVERRRRRRRRRRNKEEDEKEEEQEQDPRAFEIYWPGRANEQGFTAKSTKQYDRHSRMTPIIGRVPAEMASSTRFISFLHLVDFISSPIIFTFFFFLSERGLRH